MSDKDGNTALHLASMNGHEPIVKLLLSYSGTNIFLKNKNGKTALESTFYAGIAK